MEKTNSTEKLRLLDAAHPVSWKSSSSPFKTGSNNQSNYFQHPLEQTVPRRFGLIQGKIHRDGNQYIMYLQSFNDTNNPIYVGSKNKPRSKYVIQNLAGDSIGNLSKTSSKGSSIEYSLRYYHDPKLLSSTENVATIQYQVPSAIQVLTDGPPRRANVVLLGRDALETKEPYCKEGGRCGLDFRGRGSEPSRKNVQLQDRNGKVVLQMVKWGKDEFNLDFA